MAKRRKANLIKQEEQSISSCPVTLNVGKYSRYFTELPLDEKICLKDESSNTDNLVHVCAKETEVFLAKPDGELIPEKHDQKKCDFLTYAKNQFQLCFFEFKGKNISTHRKDNPHIQIAATLKYLRQQEDLKPLFQGRVEFHAFIVSPADQKLLSGLSSYERNLEKEFNLHYVRVCSKKGEYKDNNRTILCSKDRAIPIPYHSPK